MGRGGKWIRGREKNTAIPQRRHGEIPDEKNPTVSLDKVVQKEKSP